MKLSICPIVCHASRINLHHRHELIRQNLVHLFEIQDTTVRQRPRAARPTE